MSEPIYCEGECQEVLTAHGRRVQLCGEHAALFRQLAECQDELFKMREQLATARQDVWEEAAKLIEEGVDVPYECGPGNWKTFKSNACKRMAAMCRQQAEGVKP